MQFLNISVAAALLLLINLLVCVSLFGGVCVFVGVGVGFIVYWVCLCLRVGVLSLSHSLTLFDVLWTCHDLALMLGVQG